MLPRSYPHVGINSAVHASISVHGGLIPLQAVSFSSKISPEQAGPALSGTLCPLPGAGCGPRLRAVWMTCSQRLGGSIFVLPSVWFWTVFFQDHRDSRMQRAFSGRKDPFPMSRNHSRPGVSKKRTRGERCHKDNPTQYPYFFRWAETLPGERCKRCAICQMLFLFRKYRV